ncbi:hypothetical protein [Jeotgalibacillus salarius]|uniref:DUF2188 domain-containing protein n=1 Tax=Jeotgalibacillus salarius TaxID=546023 RepID=A0A4Y8LQN5_9BACL|nr:hypothetical protein [Jeotgalibacillus salarius]TFE03779.1 hypothetical protein E2626_00170 [Jeotgalibacillus salarius]
MPWSKNDYPDSWKNLDPDVRNKAIEIGNALLRDENYDESRVIAIATDKAKQSVQQDDQDTYQLKPHDNGWQLVKRGSDQAIYVEETKNALEEKAKSYVTSHGGQLEMYKEDGSFDETLYESKNSSGD